MVPIPEGSESYSEEPTDSEYSSTQEALDQPMDQPEYLTGSGGWPSARSKAEGAEPTMTIDGLCELSGYQNHVI